MLWLLLSYIPARVWFYVALFGVASTHGAFSYKFIIGAPNASAWQITFSFISVYLVLWPVISRFRTAKLMRLLRSRATEARAKISRNAIDVIEAGWLVTHMLRVRTGGVLALLTLVVGVAVTTLPEEAVFPFFMGDGSIFARLSNRTTTDLVRNFRYTLMLPGFFWGTTVLVVIWIRRVLGLRVLSYTIALILLSPAVYTLLVSLVTLMDAWPVALLMVLAGAPFLVVHVPLAIRIISSTKILPQPANPTAPPSLQASLNRIVHAKMVLFGEGFHAEKGGMYVPWEECAGSARILMTLTFLLFPFGIILAFALAQFLTLLGFLSLPILGLALYAWDISKRLRLHSARDVLASDLRAPILVLRSFIDDGANVQGKTFFRMRERVLELTAKWCFQLGPVITFGRPGEKFARSGPPRLYVENARWKNELSAYLAKSRLIVIVVGETQALQWEIEQIITKGLLRKTIFVVPPLGIDDVKVRWEKLLEIFPRPTQARPGFSSHHATRAFLEKTRMVLEAIDPSTALVLGYDQARLLCLTSTVRNRLSSLSSSVSTP